MIMELGLESTNSLFGAIDFSSIDFSSLNLSQLHLSWHLDWQTFAQQFNQDVTKDLAGGWNNFVKTGQIWALLIGLTLGYLFKSITSF